MLRTSSLCPIEFRRSSGSVFQWRIITVIAAATGTSPTCRSSSQGLCVCCASPLCLESGCRAAVHSLKPDSGSWLSWSLSPTDHASEINRLYLNIETTAWWEPWHRKGRKTLKYSHSVSVNCAAAVSFSFFDYYIIAFTQTIKERLFYCHYVTT